MRQTHIIKYEHIKRNANMSKFETEHIQVLSRYPDVKFPEFSRTYIDF